MSHYNRITELTDTSIKYRGETITIGDNVRITYLTGHIFFGTVKAFFTIDATPYNRGMYIADRSGDVRPYPIKSIGGDIKIIGVKG